MEAWFYVIERDRYPLLLPLDTEDLETMWAWDGATWVLHGYDSEIYDTR